MSNLGFVGIGRMGSLMVPRLIDAGYSVTVHDVEQRAIESVVAKGAVPAGSAAGVTEDVEIAFLSLPTPEIVRTVALEMSDSRKLKYIVDLSTTGPRVAAEIAEVLTEKRITYVDAPVSGGLQGARDGTLSVMVACPRAAYERVGPILKNFGKLFFIGERAGQGQTVKIGNNMISAAVIVLSAEVLAMGVKAGVDPKIMCDVLSVSSGRNSAVQDKFPKSILPGTFDFGFTTGLSYKDVRLCVDEAENLGVPMVMGSIARQYLAATASRYGYDSDFTNLARLVEEWAGVEIRSKG